MQDTLRVEARVSHPRSSPACQSLQLIPQGELQGTCKLPRSCRDPKKRQPQNSLGCRIRSTSPAYAHCDLRVAPGHNARLLRLRLPARHRARKGGGSRCLTKKKMGLRRSLGPRFFVSYLRVLHGSLTRRLLLLLLQLPARNTARDTSHAHDLPARLTAAPRPPRSSLPRAPLQPISARGAHFALSQQGRSEREIAALATGLANQLARPTEGAERGHEGGESVERRGLATHQSKGASAPRAPPCPAPWWRRCGNQGKRRLPQGGGEGANS